MDQESVPATMNKSGLQIEAEELSQDIQTPSTCWSGLVVPGVENHCHASRCWSTEESRDRCAKSEPMGDVGLSLEAGPLLLSRILGRTECQSARVQDTSRIRPSR